jgi:hypothetical protein
MADTRISGLPVASVVGLADLIAIVQGGVTKQAALSLLPAFGSVYLDAVSGNDQSFATISAAIAAAAAGDVIRLGPGTFTENSGISIPNNVSLFGSGIGITIIQSSLSGGSQHAIVVPGNNSIIADLTIKCTSGSGTLQYPIGAGGADQTFTNAKVYRVSATGINPIPDVVYINQAGTFSLTLYDCVFASGSDCINIVTGAATIEAYNCSFTSDGTFAGTSARCIAVSTGSTGTIRIFGGKITSSGGSSTNYGAYITATGGTLELFNVLTNVSGTGAVDLYRLNGTLGVAGVTREDGAALLTSGTITQLSRNALLDLANTLAGALTLAVGTASLAPLNVPAGTLKTTPVAGDHEFDGVQIYATIDATSKRGAIPVEQYFHLAADGATISTIANFFGTTSNISLVSNAYYEIEIYLYFLNTTAGTVTWTLTNSAAPTSQNVYFEMSPIAGVQALPGSTAALTNLMMIGQKSLDATAALAFTTGTLATGVDHYARFKIFLKNGTGTSLKIQATKSTGTITPRLNSWWFCKRRSPNNIGTFAA